MNNSRAPLIAGVVLAIAVLLGLNVMQQRNDPALQKQAEQLREQEEAKKQESNAASSAAAPSAPAAGANRLAEIGDSFMVGSDKAPREVVLGWQWTPEVQANPSKVYDAIEEIQKAANSSGGRFRVRIVNVDANPSVPPGISIGGVVRVAPQPDGAIQRQALMPALSPLMQQP